MDDVGDFIRLVGEFRERYNAIPELGADYVQVQDGYDQFRAYVAEIHRAWYGETTADDEDDERQPFTRLDRHVWMVLSVLVEDLERTIVTVFDDENGSIPDDLNGWDHLTGIGLALASAIEMPAFADFVRRESA